MPDTQIPEAFRLDSGLREDMVISIHSAYFAPHADYPGGPCASPVSTLVPIGTSNPWKSVCRLGGLDNRGRHDDLTSDQAQATD